MEQKDLDLKLLAGLPLSVNGIGSIQPVKLREVAKIGESKYNEYLSYMCMDIDNLNIEDETKEEMKSKGITPFILILSQCLQDKSEEFLKTIQDAFSFFLKEKTIFIPQLNIFFLGSEDRLNDFLNNVKDAGSKEDLEKILEGEKTVNENNFNEFVDVLKVQNCLGDKQEEEKYKPSNKKAQEIADKLKKSKEKINKIKAKKGETLDLGDLISAYSAYSNSVDIIKVWELTFYQFNNQFQRTQLINDYEINIQSLLHGADPKKTKIKHFVSKMN